MKLLNWKFAAKVVKSDEERWKEILSPVFISGTEAKWDQLTEMLDMEYGRL